MSRLAGDVFVSLLWLGIGPGLIAGYLPWAVTGWAMRPPFLGNELTRWAGGLLIALGLPVLLGAFARFVLQGHGTAAPLRSPTRLVVTGAYRHVRNPMYVAVTAVIVGQALLFGDVRLFWLALVVWAVFHAFVLSYEEPRLRRQFGTQYADYSAAVGRWLPGIRPWQGPR